MPITLLHPSAYANAKKPFPPVGKLDADGIDAAVDRLVADGGLVLPEFQKAFEFLCKLSNASTAKITNHEEKPAKERDATSVGPLKKKPRIVEKALNDYIDVKPPVAAVLDIVRATMAFDGPKQMLFAIEKLVTWEGQTLGGTTATYRLAQAKELYSKKLQSLYGDVKLSLLLYVDGVPDGHVCELQLNTVGIIAAKCSSTGHVAYEAERTLENKWKDEHGSSVPRLVDIEADWALYQEDPSRTDLRNYGGKSAGMKDASIEDYLELYRPLIPMMVKAYGPARTAFDQHPDAPKIIARIKELSGKVAARWSDRYETFGMWPKLG
jgi:hypothetical protein